MNRKIKQLVIYLTLFLGASEIAFSQEAPKSAEPEKPKTKEKPVELERTKQLPSVCLGIGVLTFNGDVGNDVKLSSFGRIKTGYNLSVEERIGKYIGVSIGGLYGKLSNDASAEAKIQNFQSKIMQGELLLIGHFDNDLIFKRDMLFAPYIYAGVGYLKFDPYGDLKDKDGKTYHLWQDGTLRDIDESAPNYFMAQEIQRDYTYETKLDSTNAYPHSSVIFPLGIGFKFKLHYNFDINLAATYYLTMTDNIDNYKQGGTDKYLYLNISAQYNFGKEKNYTQPIYKNIDFSSMDKEDTDGDGVRDKDDKCPGTPKGAKVDSKGCPLDTDGDGVPDYKDKELDTQPGAIVDEYGQTVSEEQIAHKQMMYDSLATEREKLLFENPNLGYLQEVEAKIKQAHSDNKLAAKGIPEKLKIADKNNDGFISTSEITKSIDEFFDGESGWTVEKLNELIDFFFEQ